ncbi:ABC transporter ATP-binding protein/permease [Brevibacillus humidisoli]|uniref:ABC transporter ATP-binding protein n=1 Tax=Brevibacillus humidisoli TaxID=2895522 RepID=UPI001E436598|nr:ABC transporter ATP-binding protein [Brevibacillus humidisoli]UFJ43430.1 ABC transporter ATP-binding protein/permease [Brevibacillus humidisoli]
MAEPPKMMIILALLLSVIDTIGGLIVPYLTKDVVDLMTAQAINYHIVAWLVVAFLVQAAASGGSIYILSYIGHSTVAGLRKRLWKKVMALPVSYFDQHRTGETISRLTSDTDVIKDLVSTHLISFVSNLVSIIGSVVILSYLDWRMTLMLLLAVPIMFLLMYPMGRKIHKISKELQDETARMSGLLTGVVSEIRLVKSFHAEETEQQQGNSSIDNLFRYSLREAKVHAWLMPLMTLTMMGMLVLIVGYGGVRVASGALSAGELVAFLLYLFMIVIPFSSLAQFYAALQKGMGATERISGILAHDEEERAEERKRPISQINQPIHLEDVRFAYPSGEQVLHGITLTIHPGKATALVGPSGAGKTTLFALLERFYQPSRGRILLGDTPIDLFRLTEWRKQIGYVAQDSPMMAGTIRENMCYGMDRPVSQEELDAAAKQAYADEFIANLPQRYDTEIGERGIKLSGGQRQRIAIARAILHDPQILLLDEATSNLDSQSEVWVQKAIQELMKERTTIVIAHRLATVVKADQIVVLEAGRVTGIGTHEELLASHPLYRELSRHQFLSMESAAL